MIKPWTQARMMQILIGPMAFKQYQTQATITILFRIKTLLASHQSSHIINCAHLPIDLADLPFLATQVFYPMHSPRIFSIFIASTHVQNSVLINWKVETTLLL